MRNHAERNRIKHICPPKLGWGLDNFQWQVVHISLHDVFRNSILQNNCVLLPLTSIEQTVPNIEKKPGTTQKNGKMLKKYLKKLGLLRTKKHPGKPAECSIPKKIKDRSSVSGQPKPAREIWLSERKPTNLYLVPLRKNKVPKTEKPKITEQRRARSLQKGVLYTHTSYPIWGLWPQVQILNFKCRNLELLPLWVPRWR